MTHFLNLSRNYRLFSDAIKFVATIGRSGNEFELLSEPNKEQKTDERSDVESDDKKAPATEPEKDEPENGLFRLPKPVGLRLGF